MKKTLLQEVKAMNKIAGTQMTKEQELTLIKERLQQLNELELGTPKSTEDIKAFYKKTRKLTDDNNHSEAAIELAKFMDDKESLKTLDKIKKDRDKRGYLTDKDSKIRSGITTNLLQKAKQQYKGKDYDKITGAF